MVLLGSLTCPTHWHCLWGNNYILVTQCVTSQVLHWFYNSSFLHINIRIFMNSCKFYQIRKTMYLILCRFRKKVPFDLFGWTACWSKSFKADLTSWICVKALLLQRTSLQGEIELPLQSTKLKSESDFWRHFRVLCHARLVGDAYLLAHIYIFLFQLWKFDAGGQSHNMVYSLHHFMHGIYCMTVKRSYKGKWVLLNPWHKRLWRINNFCKRRLGTIMLRLQNRYFWWPLSNYN